MPRVNPLVHGELLLFLWVYVFAQVKRENKASKNKSRSHQVTIHQKWFPLFTRDFSRFYDQLWSMAGGHYTVSRSGRSGSKITNVLRSAHTSPWRAQRCLSGFLRTWKTLKSTHLLGRRLNEKRLWILPFVEELLRCKEGPDAACRNRSSWEAAAESAFFQPASAAVEMRAPGKWDLKKNGISLLRSKDDAEWSRKMEHRVISLRLGFFILAAEQSLLAPRPLDVMSTCW